MVILYIMLSKTINPFQNYFRKWVDFFCNILYNTNCGELYPQSGGKWRF